MDHDVLVGWAHELTDFERRLASALAGHGGLVFVEGEAGAGKTALANSLVRRAREAGMRTAWGACLEGEGASAYRPWLQILRELGEPGSLLLDPAGGEAGSRHTVVVFDSYSSASRFRALVESRSRLAAQAGVTSDILATVEVVADAHHQGGPR